MRLQVLIMLGLVAAGSSSAWLLIEPAPVETILETPPPPAADSDAASCRKFARRTYQGDAVDTFDISGLTLRMNSNDVQEIMNCAHTTERSLTMKECASDLIEHERLWQDARKRGVVNTKTIDRSCLGSIVWREQQRRVTVNFVEDVPANPGRMIVYQISTEQEGAVNEASLRAFRKALIDKYGKPLNDSKTDLIWGKYPAPQLRFFPYAQFYLDLVHRGLKTEQDRVMLKFVSDAAPTVEPRL